MVLTFEQYLESQTLKSVILVMTGAFSPSHTGHFKDLQNAKSWMESQGHKVVGGYISPKHDSYVKSKGVQNWVPLEKRIRIIQAMTPDWVQAHTWEAQQDAPRSRFDVLAKIQEEHPESKVVFVCGEDAHFDQMPETLPGLVQVRGFLNLVLPRDLSGASSTKVRNLIRAGQSTGGLVPSDIEKDLRAYWSQ